MVPISRVPGRPELILRAGLSVVAELLTQGFLSRNLALPKVVVRVLDRRDGHTLMAYAYGRDHEAAGEHVRQLQERLARQPLAEFLSEIGAWEAFNR